MVHLDVLVVPVLLSSVLVFVASALLHMVLPFHRSDIRKVAEEDGLLDALRSLKIPPGDYGAPMPASPQAMSEPAFVEKFARGPVVVMTVAPGGPVSMTRSLVLWFIYVLVVTALAAFVAIGALPSGASYPRVFHTVGLAAFLGYALALPQQAIWYRRSWTTTVKGMIDGLIYGMLTAGTFGWLWPR